jgi:hypothetical protein
MTGALRRWRHRPGGDAARKGCWPGCCPRRCGSGASAARRSRSARVRQQGGRGGHDHPVHRQRRQRRPWQPRQTGRPVVNIDCDRNNCSRHDPSPSHTSTRLTISAFENRSTFEALIPAIGRQMVYMANRRVPRSGGPAAGDAAEPRQRRRGHPSTRQCATAGPAPRPRPSSGAHPRCGGRPGPR